jgi:hypothetical protein
MMDTLALICFMLGDWISRTPLLNIKIGWMAYQKLMLWTVELDKHDKLWTRQD